MRIKLIELFGGIGACTQALKRIGVDVEIVDYVEIDKYAVKSYNAINSTNFEPQDIRKWDKQVEVDLIMHGSPCQDFSIAGNQAGGDEGSGTRSSLMYETLRIVKKLKPKYVVWENVPNLLSNQHIHNFKKYLKYMIDFGYSNYYKILNAKDYEIPQNRERLFTVSILNGDGFEFPDSKLLKIMLKDVLEDEVEEKYYLSQRMIDFFYDNEQKQKENGNGFRFGVSDGNTIAKAVTTRAGGRMDDNFIKCKHVGNLDINGMDCIKRVYSAEGLSPTLTDMQGGNRQPKVDVSDRIRKLTPKECWRLMGFDDESFEKAAKVNSNTQLYKQAGNSIVVNVLESIFKCLLLNEYKGTRVKKLF